MREEVKTTYNGVEITYDEHDDVWRFEARGRERKAKTLKNAKETIDKPDPKEKKPFEPFDAIFSRYSEEFIKVTVTSIADNDGRGQYVWISRNGSRSKERLDTIYVISPENLAAMKRHRELQKEINERQNEQRLLISKLEHPVVEV